MFRQPSSWIFVLLPNAISDFLVHCLGHEHAYRIRSFCGHSNGCLLRIGTPSPFVHPPILILLCSWLCLRLPASCVAVRTGRTGMVGYCSGKVVVRSETENPALRVDERNRDLDEAAGAADATACSWDDCFFRYKICALSDNGPQLCCTTFPADPADWIKWRNDH